MLFTFEACECAVRTPRRTEGVAFIGLDGREGAKVRKELDEICDLDASIPWLQREPHEAHAKARRVRLESTVHLRATKEAEEDAEIVFGLGERCALRDVGRRLGRPPHLELCVSLQGCRGVMTSRRAVVWMSPASCAYLMRRDWWTLRRDLKRIGGCDPHSFGRGAPRRMNPHVE